MGAQQSGSDGKEVPRGPAEYGLRPAAVDHSWWPLSATAQSGTKTHAVHSGLVNTAAAAGPARQVKVPTWFFQTGTSGELWVSPVLYPCVVLFVPTCMGRGAAMEREPLCL